MADALERRLEIAQARSIAQELTQAQRARAREERERAMRCPACGAGVSQQGRHCYACGHKHGRVRVREHGIEHVCADCGRAFLGYESDVYCSALCRKRMTSKIGRGHYPALGSLPRTERNRLAALVALVRAANRRLQAEA